MDIAFPEGYSYDKSSHAVYGPSGAFNAAMPSYVTGITLTISGDGMDTVTLPVDMNTLSVSFVITPGIRTFSIVISTSIGLTFTDSVTVEVMAGAPVNLRFNLVVNAPPAITAISASPAAAAPGGVVALSCSASDLDPADQLSYQWSGPGFAANGPSASFSVPGYGFFTFTCTVSDGRGGTASSTVSVTAPAPNLPPYVTKIYITDSQVLSPATSFWGGASVILTCEARDPEGDPISYSLYGPNGLIANGPSAQFTLSSNCQSPVMPYPEEYACAVSDPYNKPAAWGVKVYISPAC